MKGIGEIMKNVIRLNNILCYEVMLEKENASDTVDESKKRYY